MRILTILTIMICMTIMSFGQEQMRLSKTNQIAMQREALRQEIEQQIREEEIIERLGKERINRQLAFQFHMDRVEQEHAHRMRINNLRHQYRIEMMRSYHFHQGRTKYGRDWHAYMRHRSLGGNGRSLHRGSRYMMSQPSFGHHGR